MEPDYEGHVAQSILGVARIVWFRLAPPHRRRQLAGLLASRGAGAGAFGKEVFALTAAKEAEVDPAMAWRVMLKALQARFMQKIPRTLG